MASESHSEPQCVAVRARPNLPLLPDAEAGRAEAQPLGTAFAGLQKTPVQLRAAQADDAALHTTTVIICSQCCWWHSRHLLCTWCICWLTVSSLSCRHPRTINFTDISMPSRLHTSSASAL